MKVTAIIVAAGRGERFGGQVSKQFLEINGKPILFYTLEKFERCASIDEIVAVVPKDLVESLHTSVNRVWQLEKVTNIVQGGSERYNSVFEGLKVTKEDVEIVVIHDGVRPCVSIGLIERTVGACRQYGAVIAGVPPKDTIKERNGNIVRKTLVRSELVAVQTPQAFKRGLIFRAYRHALKIGLYNTDDAALVEELGHPVTIIEGEYTNIKITSADDLILAENIMKEEEKF